MTNYPHALASVDFLPTDAGLPRALLLPLGAEMNTYPATSPSPTVAGAFHSLTLAGIPSDGAALNTGAAPTSRAQVSSGNPDERARVLYSQICERVQEAQDAAKALIGKRGRAVALYRVEQAQFARMALEVEIARA